MNKFFVAFIIVLVFSISAFSQAGTIFVKNGPKGMHLEHAVAPKEGFFSIARIYNVHPKALAAYNNLDLNKGLSIGQLIQVPLTDTNFTQSKNKGTPLYYKVGEKEGLMSISNTNNKVKLQSIRDWNKLKNDNVSAGSKLIVGFLVAPEMPAVASNTGPKEEPRKPIDTKAEDKAVVIDDKKIVKEEPKAEEKKPELKKEEVKPIVAAVTKPDVTMNMSGQGYFKSSFDQQVKNIPITKTETVTSGIFKTTSGMQDAKFYLLMDGVSSGTVIRIINPENNRTIYAKVLGEMNGIRQNQGLNIRMSNGAASTLGISDTEKFIVKINY